MQMRKRYHAAVTENRDCYVERCIISQTLLVWK